MNNVCVWIELAEERFALKPISLHFFVSHFHLNLWQLTIKTTVGDSLLLKPG